MHKPVITLKNIKHSEFASEETNCYEATLYVDGEKWGKVSNEGHGGADSFHGNGGKNYDDIRKLDEQIAATYPVDDSYGITIEASLETVCGDLVCEFLSKRDFKRLLKKPTYINDKGHIMQFKVPKGVTLDRVLVAVRQKKPEVTLLNDMSEDEGFAAFRKATGGM